MLVSMCYRIPYKVLPPRGYSVMSYAGANQLLLKGVKAPPSTNHFTFQSRRYKHNSFRDLRVVWRNVFGKYLLITNVVGSGVLMVVGDIAAQEIEYRKGEKPERFDLKRMGRMFIVGALQGPMHHYVYAWMDKIMPVANLKNIVKKILIDQLFMSPACIFIFFYSACYLERKTWKETNDELRQKFLFIYCMDWLLWPGAQYVNFRYLDTKYRVSFVNICTALYNIFMSYVKHDY
ncbi:mpv17-like protein 2 [Stomoxys calcitrans]|uniref:Mpv17-like protein 2 n=1 Tax=Stomoxys calcitrans TaxID=35570 RepID=A0A1I8Q477_STOCA|nr:mpv17-like protein 2 [Stomoxys calcitrans]